MDTDGSKIEKILSLSNFALVSERSKEMRKNKKKIKGSILVAESTYNSQNAQFGFVMVKLRLFLVKLKRFDFGFTFTTMIQISKLE